MMRVMMCCFVFGCGLTVGCSKSKPTASDPDSTGSPLVKSSSQLDLDQRELAQNNFKAITLAIHNYHDSYGALPNVEIKLKPGKANLSWRVHLLPFLEEQRLYLEFKLDEPWDSPANKPLIAKMPKAYAPVHAKAQPGMTFTRGFTGKGTPFEEGLKLNFGNLADGAPNTIGVIEAGEAVAWTQPGNDIPFDKTKPLPKLGGDVDGDFHAALLNGLAIVIKRDFDETAMKGAITRNGGEVPEIQKLTSIRK